MMRVLSRGQGAGEPVCTRRWDQGNTVSVDVNSLPAGQRLSTGVFVLEQWFYSHCGQKVLRPVTSGELKSLASTGELGPYDRVRTHGMVQPVTALRIKGLFATSDHQRLDLANPLPSVVC